MTSVHERVTMSFFFSLDHMYHNEIFSEDGWFLQSTVMLLNNCPFAFTFFEKAPRQKRFVGEIWLTHKKSELIQSLNCPKVFLLWYVLNLTLLSSYFHWPIMLLIEAIFSLQIFWGKIETQWSLWTQKILYKF